MPPDEFLRVFHLLLGKAAARMMRIGVPSARVSTLIFYDPPDNPPRLPNRGSYRSE